MLLEAAIGDAYGVGFEYKSKNFVIENNLVKRYFSHERYQSLYKKYSDDTQMSLAIAELMINHDVWTDELIANKFLEVFKRDIRPGDILEDSWNKEWQEPVGEKGYMAVTAAITAIKRNKNMTQLLKDCIGFTGDVDTVATIALGAASFSAEIENNLPEWLYEELENGEYGRNYLIKLDALLKSKFARPT